MKTPKYSIWFILLFVSACSSDLESRCTTSLECEDGFICQQGRCLAPPGSTPTDSSQSNPSKSRAENQKEIENSSKNNPSSETSTCSTGASPLSEGDLKINEIMANVPRKSTADYNGDGERSARGDEFIELVNTGSTSVSTQQISIQIDDNSPFSPREECLDPGETIVIFGAKAEKEPPFSKVHFDSHSKLSLPNSKGRIRITATGRTITQADYRDAPRESYVLSPELEGAEYIRHSELNSDRAASPGKCASGRPLSKGCGSE